MSEIAERVAQALPPEATHRAIARDVDMTPDALSRALSGERRFSAIELARLADRLNVDLHWLITGFADPRRSMIAARHDFDPATGLRAVPGRASDESLIADISLAYRQALDALHRPKRDIPREVEGVRAALGQDFVRPFADRLERNLGIDVVRVTGLSTSWSLRIGDHLIIVLAATGNWFRENWSIAHELGHLVNGHLDKDQEHSTSAHDERSANSFAAQLLLPDAVMRSVDWKSLSLSDLADFVWIMGVSTDAVARRMSGVGMDAPELVREWAAQPTQRLLRRHWRAIDPFDDPITRRMDEASVRRFPVTLQDAHVELIGSGALGKDTLAWMLGVPADELDVDAPLPPEPLSAEELVDMLGA